MNIYIYIYILLPIISMREYGTRRIEFLHV